MPRVSVVIPNYNGEAFLEDCLSSLEAQTFHDMEVIVVDNASTDGSVDLVRGKFPGVRLIESGGNLGFGAGCNIGIHASDSELVVLLNNDTRCEPTFVEAFVEAMDETPEASLGAAKMLRSDPPHVIDSAGDWFDLRKGGGANIGAGESNRLHTDRAWVFGAMAGAAIYRRTLFDEIGDLDAEFFLVNEDTDFNLRAMAAGHRCLYVPEAVVYHKRGVSGDRPAPWIRAISLRNRWWVVGKNLPLPLIAVWLFWAGARGIRMLIHIVASRLRGMRAHPPGYFDGYAPRIKEAFSKMAAKRRRVAHTRKLGWRELWRRIDRVRTPLDE